MLHTPVLVWVSCFQNDEGQKCKRNKNTKKTHELVQGNLLFCFVVSACHRQDQINKLMCTLMNKQG